MIPYERRQQLLNLIKKSDYVSMEQLVKEMEGASESTIRRDLRALAEEGSICLVRGGASLKKADFRDERISEYLTKHREEKEKIARYAASLIEDGETIYLDSGSTTLRMIPFIRNRNITIVTTNTLIFHKLIGGRAECIVVGGTVNQENGSIIGDTAVAQLQSLYFDTAFLGAAGISRRAGISTSCIKESRKRQVVKTHAQKTYVLADSSKAGVTGIAKVFELEEVTVIMEKYMEILEECGGYIVAERPFR